MFSIHNIKNSKEIGNVIEISSTSKQSFAKINLNLGASLQELCLGGHKLIQDMYPLPYEETYASSILFPFANRVKDGSYSFQGQHYQLLINEEQHNNAIHGMVYNKTFQVIGNDVSTHRASIQLVYHEKLECKGFPYTYSIFVEYVLTESNLLLNVKVKNTHNKVFPFTLGWHPYFLSSDLYQSEVKFDCKEKLNLDERNITLGKTDFKEKDGLKIEDQLLDDCFILQSKTVHFNTPAYTFGLSTTEQDCFLQLYTPPKKNTIAIEPTTGVSDSFNNSIGLKTLEPNEIYVVGWSLKIKE